MAYFPQGNLPLTQCMKQWHLLQDSSVLMNSWNNHGRYHIPLWSYPRLRGHILHQSVFKLSSCCRLYLRIPTRSFNLPFIGYVETSYHKLVYVVHCLLLIILSYCPNFCPIRRSNEFGNSVTNVDENWEFHFRLEMGAVSCTKTFVTAYENTRCHTTESHNLNA